MPEVFSVKLAGPAGTGIMSAGEILFHSLVSTGYYCQGYPEYPSLIKGGHNVYLITLSENPYPVNSEHVDLLAALTQTALNNEHEQIDNDTIVVCDSTIKPDHEIKKLYQPDLLGVAKTSGNPLTLNTATLGFLTCQLKIEKTLVWKQIEEELGKKSAELLNQNKISFDKGFEFSEKFHFNLPLPEKKNKSFKLCLNGSQATGLGAIAAGINLYAGYPMTPSSPLLHFMAEHQTEFKYLVRQTEDELSAINMIIGASYAGAKSMTGTSGGGFALMNEGLSLAGMLETPIVIYLGMRPAPATGLPTWTSQSDLLYTINAGHGEFPRIVIAPSDPKDCYQLTHQAFTLAERFHVPVIILSDKYLAENTYCLENLPPLDPVALNIANPDTQSDGLYARYQFSLSGVHPRTIPGVKNGEYIANSDEHNSVGLVDESYANRLTNNQRRQAKVNEITKTIPLPEVSRTADTAVLSWGSHKYIAAEVAAQLHLAHIHFSYLWPLPIDLKKLLLNYQKLITIENNTTHQLARLITQETGLKINLMLGEDSGRPLNPQSLINQIKNES